MGRLFRSVEKTVNFPWEMDNCKQGALQYTHLKSKESTRTCTNTSTRDKSSLLTFVHNTFPLICAHVVNNLYQRGSLLLVHRARSLPPPGQIIKMNDRYLSLIPEHEGPEHRDHMRPPEHQE